MVSFRLVVLALILLPQTALAGPFESPKPGGMSSLPRITAPPLPNQSYTPLPPVIGVSPPPPGPQPAEASRCHQECNENCTSQFTGNPDYLRTNKCPDRCTVLVDCIGK
jgi:hypothetical protein